MKLDDYLVLPDTPIVDVMKHIDQNAKGIVYVCDSEMVLKGVITDGDVRRSIIQRGRLDSIAEEIMKCHPVTIRVSESRYAEKIMRKHQVRSVPLVDDSGRIQDIFFLDRKSSDTIIKGRIDSPVVIMAGGKGTRLQPFTSILPKPLIPIGEKTITEHILDRFLNVGCSRYVMILNYKKHLIQAYIKDSDINANIEFIEEEEYLGTGGGLRLLLNRFNESFFVTNCDILIEEDYSTILEYHRKSRNIATIVCAVKNMTLPYGVVKTSEEGKITAILEKPDISSIVNTGFYVLEPEFIEKIPDGKVSQITDLFQRCIDSGDRVGMYPVSEDKWMDMGQFDVMQKMTERIGNISGDGID